MAYNQASYAVTSTELHAFNACFYRYMHGSLIDVFYQTSRVSFLYKEKLAKPALRLDMG